MRPILTVCVVTYHHEEYIEQCLESIIAQKTDFEYVIHVGEEGGTDQTRTKVNELVKKYPNLVRLYEWSREDVILVNGQSTGRFNFKETIKSASTKYIALCDGDDYWTDPYKLQRQVDFLENHNDYGICFHDVKIYNNNTGTEQEDLITREVPETTSILDLAQGNYIHTVSAVMRNDFIFPDWFDLVYTGDWCLYMIQLKNRKIKKINRCMASYRVHDNSLWSSMPSKMQKQYVLSTTQILYDYLKLPDAARKLLYSRIKKLQGPSKLSKIKTTTKHHMRAWLTLRFPVVLKFYRLCKRLV